MDHTFFTPLEKCQLKFDEKTDGLFEGYASVFDGLDSYGDTIKKGAYKKTIKALDKLPMFVNHDTLAIPVGDWLELKEDNTGLFVKGQIDMNHNEGMPLLSAIKRKQMDGLSINYRVPKGGQDYNQNTNINTLTEIVLREISVVNFPADLDARITDVKKEELTLIQSMRDAENYLRDLGFTKADALLFLSRIGKIKRREAEKDYSEQINILEGKLAVTDHTNNLVEFINSM